MRDRVDEVLGVLTFIAQDPDVLVRQETALRGFFGKSRRRVQVFLALDPGLNVTEVSQRLSMKPQNVSREIQALHERGLVTRTKTGGRGEVWVRNPVLERVGLATRVRGWFVEAPAQYEMDATHVAVDGVATNDKADVGDSDA